MKSRIHRKLDTLQIRITTRRVWVSLSQSYPHAGLFWLVYERLRLQP